MKAPEKTEAALRATSNALSTLGRRVTFKMYGHFQRIKLESRKI